MGVSALQETIQKLKRKFEGGGGVLPRNAFTSKSVAPE